MQAGICKECFHFCPLTKVTKVAYRQVWECPACGHPHREHEFLRVFTQVDDLHTAAQAFSANLSRVAIISAGQVFQPTRVIYCQKDDGILIEAKLTRSVRKAAQPR